MKLIGKMFIGIFLIYIGLYISDVRERIIRQCNSHDDGLTPSYGTHHRARPYDGSSFSHKIPVV